MKEMRCSHIAIYRNIVIYRVYVVAECMLFFVAHGCANNVTLHTSVKCCRSSDHIQHRF